MNIINFLGAVILLNLFYALIHVLYLSAAERRFYDRRIRKLKWTLRGFSLVKWVVIGLFLYALWTVHPAEKISDLSLGVWIFGILGSILVILVETLKDTLGRTPLMQASVEGKVNLVKELDDKGADINLRDIKGRSALMFAIWGGSEEIVSLLIAKRADLEIFDLTGRTPLMYAVLENKPAIIKDLLASKVDISCKSLEGLTAKEYAEKQNNDELIRLFVNS